MLRFARAPGAQYAGQFVGAPTRKAMQQIDSPAGWLATEGLDPSRANEARNYIPGADDDPRDCSRGSIDLTIATLPSPTGSRSERMRNPLLATAMALAIGLFGSAVHAQDSGFYVRGSVGSSDLSNADIRLSNNSETGFGLGLGWRILPWLAVETGYNQFGEFEQDPNFCPPGVFCPAVVSPPRELDLDSVELGLAARTTTADSGFFGQVRGGLHRGDAGPVGSRSDLYYGIGVGYSFNPRYNLSLNLDRYEFRFFDVDRISLGFEVVF
jgi:hypothetical protein